MVFKEREHLNFDLISDADGAFIRLLGIGMWQTTDSEIEKETFPMRSTVIIKAGGLVEDIISIDNVEGHVNYVLKEVRTMTS